jgi:molybdopterin/thiamine biosynthesis adenylyltransferase
MDCPKVLNLLLSKDKKIFNELLKHEPVIKDYFLVQLKELFGIRFPKYKSDSDKALSYAKNYLDKTGIWIYYPWRNTLIHILSSKDYFELRTARNYPLISKNIQKKLHSLKIGVAGLSVGSNIVRSLVYAGIGSVYHLADGDELALSNINRITGNLLNMGENKTEILARQLWEIDPFLVITMYPSGLSSENLMGFLYKDHKLDLVFDEVDDLSLKFYLKLAAYTLSIPYFMVTDNGFTAEIDAILFTSSKDSGGLELLPVVTMSDITNSLKFSEPIKLSPTEEQELINALISSEDRAVEMKSAAQLKLSQKIVGWPQLHAVANVGASLAVFSLIDFVSGTLKSGKKMLSLK